MMKKHYPALIVAAVICGFAPVPNLDATVVINEFMASNGSTVADEDGDFEDWIELYNRGADEVDLSGWGLSDSDGDPFKWRFPEGTSIEAQGYLLLWASGKDRQPQGGEVLPGILREVWMGIEGTSVSDLTNHPDYPSNPTSRNLVTDLFEAPTDIADFYGQRMHATLIAPRTGNYRFWIASDDNSELHLSTDENPANAVRIAHVPGWTSPREWTKYSEQRSSSIYLVAGRRYYIAALMKEHSGGDNLAVGWRLPNLVTERPIPARHFESPGAALMHTNFRIASEGEPLVLTHRDGHTMDHVDPVYVPRDIAYGRQPDGGDTWHYFAVATPGSANTSPPVTFPPTVVASEPRGFKTSPFHVTLTATDPLAVIRYTLNGSEPGPGSPVYTEPLLITQTTTLRASAVEPGMIQLPPTTVTYLFLDDVLQQDATPPPGWPADRAINNHRMEYGLRAQIVTGDNERLRAGMMAIPSISLVTDLAHLFDPQTGIYSNSNRSHGWERPVSVELIDSMNGGTAEFQIDGGLRLRGAYSRSVDNPKHAFRLIFRSAYGENWLRFPLFEDEGADEFSKVDLRTSQNYSWAFENSNNNTFVREVFSRDSQRDMGMPYTRSRYYHLYLNGQYWGLYMTQERGEADFAATYLGGESDDWDCIKTSQPGYRTEASDGNFDAFYALHDIAINQGFAGANADNYWRVRGLNPDGTPNPEHPVYLDEDNLIAYMLVAHYTGDPDSPVSIWGGFPNNMYGLFHRAAPSGFKWLRHDAEHSLGAHGGYGVTTDTTQAGATWTARSHFNPSTLHLRLMAHPDYRMRFADLVQRHFYGDGALTPANAKARVQSRMKEIDLAIIGESARWGRGRTRDATWLPACNAVLTYLDQRRDIIVGHYRNRGWLPSIDTPRFTRGNGTVRITSDVPFYYTTDGSDPRLPGGGIHPSAVRVDTNGGVPASVTLVPRGSTWRYFDVGSEPPRVSRPYWRDPGYGDQDWPSGPAILGFAGAATANPVATTTRRWVSGTSGPQVTTTYFRHMFHMDSVAHISGLSMEILRDDGAIVYLNGVELLRENMPFGPVTYDTYASTIVGSPDQNTYFQRQSEAAHLLRSGANVVAAEVHQCNETSSDLYFDFSLTTTTHGAYGVDLPLHMAIALKARAYDGDEWSTLAETSTLSELPEGRPIHRWDFEDADDYWSPSYTWGGGTLTVLPGDSTTVTRNLPAQDFDTAHLRINDPLGAALVLELPTTGFQHVQIAYQTRRSGQGAGLQTIEYTTDGVTWTVLRTYPVEDAAPQSWSFSLANVEAANDNPDFAVRITFAEGTGGAAGNNRFDDLTLTAVPLPGTNLPPDIRMPIADRDFIENGQGTSINLDTVFVDPNGDPLSFTAQANRDGIVHLNLTGSTLTITPLRRGEATITVTASDGHYSPVPTTFGALVYPQAHVLANGLFSFGAWSPDEPAGSYPGRMLFLQSEESDTALDSPLPRAYQIPPDDAAAPEDVDSPYRASARTRINGLGNDGISFINTGRNRDLGGALVALDTRGVTTAPVAWLGGTLEPNIRIYAIRLQYRVGHSGPFLDVLGEDGQPVEYLRNPTPGHIQTIGQAVLPPEALGQPYVQLLWRYYRVSGNSGPRAQLRLDNILVANAAAQPATRLVFGDDPPSAWQSGVALPPFTLWAVDAQGFLDLNHTGPVTISVIGGAAASGTLTVNAVQGGARFANVILTGTGSHRLRATAGSLTAVESASIALVSTPLFLPGGDGDWTLDENWTSPVYPNAADAMARVHQPTAGDRDIRLRAPVVIGDLTISNMDTAYRNRIRDASAQSTLTFASASGTARLTIEGSGTGWVEVNNAAGTILANNLRITVNHMEGNMDDAHGALRLRESWTGPGGLIKDGAGILSLTGGGKDYQGSTVVEQGVLSVTESSAPSSALGVLIQPGGQLRLISSGASRVYTFGGDLVLNSLGRGGDVPHGGGEGILGGLRYEPGSIGNSAEVMNNITLAGPSGIHAANAGNTLILRGALSGTGPLTKTGGGTLLLTGASGGYTVPVTVTTGELRVDGVLGSTIALEEGIPLRGTGRVGAVTGYGIVAPGPGNATLAAGSLGPGVEAMLKLDTDGGGGSLRLTGTAPFGSGLTASSRIHLFLSRPAGSGLIFEGGFFTDSNADFLPLIEQAQAVLYVPDEFGTVEHDGTTYTPYTGSIPHTLSTVPAVRNFGEGDVSGRILRIAFVELLPAVVALDGLTAVYTGEPVTVTVTTDPPDLPVIVTYNGSTEPPVNVGNYAVVATVHDSNYAGSAQGTLVIRPDDPTEPILELHLVAVETSGTTHLHCEFDVLASEGVAVTLETSADLETWSTAEDLVGGGATNPVRVIVTADAGDSMRFWRLRADTP